MADNTEASNVETVEQQDVALDTQAQDTEQQESQQSTETKSTLDAESALKELEKTRREAAKYRTKLRDLEATVEKERTEAERAKLDESERLKAEKADVEKRLQEREQALAEASMALELQGKVSNPKAVIRLLEDKHFDADGNPDLDVFFNDYPEFKIQATEKSGGTDVELNAPTNPPEVSSGRNTSPRTKLTRADIAEMSAAEYAKNRTEILRAMKEGRL